MTKQIGAVRGIFCLLGIVLTTVAFAQTDNLSDLEQRLQKAKAAEAQKQSAKQAADQAAQRAVAARRAEQAKFGTLIVRADADCMLSVNGEVKSQLRADQASTIDVKAGQSLIECNGEGGRHVETTERIPAGEQIVVKLAIPPPARFVEVIDGVRDTQQNVIWAARDNGSDINWSGAQSYCNSLGSGWALPTSAQLQTLYDASGQYGRSLTLSGFVTLTIKPATPLINLTSFGYWSSEQNGSSKAWNVDLDDGKAFSGEVSGSYHLRVLCMRRS